MKFPPFFPPPSTLALNTRARPRRSLAAVADVAARRFDVPVWAVNLCPLSYLVFFPVGTALGLYVSHSAWGVRGAVLLSSCACTACVFLRTAVLLLPATPHVAYAVTLVRVGSPQNHLSF